MLITILLFLLAYVCIGDGMLLMICLLNEQDYMYSLLGANYSFLIIFAWPYIIDKIYNDNY